jgi:hypothetical protein
MQGQEVRTEGEWTGQGPHNVFGRYVRHYGVLRAKAEGAEVNLKASEWVILHSGNYYDRTVSGGSVFESGIVTNNGAINLTGNTSNTGYGFIYMHDGSHLNSVTPADSAGWATPGNTASGGGDITLRGNSNNASYAGIFVGHSTGQTNVFSGGGKITMVGNSTSSQPGVGISPNTDLNSGTAQIELTGTGTGGMGVELGFGNNGRVMLTSASDSSPAIAITGSTTSTARAGVLAGYHIMSHTTNKVNIQAIGSGGIDIVGTSPVNGSYSGIELKGTNILSASGAINLTGNGRGVGMQQYTNGYLYNNTFGSCSTGAANTRDSSGALVCSESLVTSSSADITIRGNAFYEWATVDALTFRSTGNLVIEPIGQYFTYRMNFFARDGGVNPKNVRIGKDVAGTALYNAPQDTFIRSTFSPEYAYEVY